MRTIVSIVIVALTAAAGVAETAWWDKAYQARREVKVYAPRGALPGDDTAVVTFYTGGHLAADGADMRVVSRGREVPYRLYGVGPGDKVTLAFKVESGTRDYQIYFGNAAAQALSYGWRPRRGLILETRGYTEGNPANVARMRRIFEEGKPFYGAGEVDKVWQGHNVFGPSERFVSRYSGELLCQTAGTYRFATSSDDASFLLVDDNVVVAWPGWHGPVADARHDGSVNLAAGVHRFEYLHVNGGGTSCAVAAWMPPGAQGFEVIPTSAFTAVSRAVVGPLELAGERVSADFVMEIAGEALLVKDEELYAVKVAFRNASTGTASTDIYWDFGDGQRGRGPGVTHIYLADGVFPVTMRTGGGEGTPSVTHRIHVHQHWGWQTEKEIDEITEYFDEIALYDAGALDGASLSGLLKLAADGGSFDFLKKCGFAALSKGAEGDAGLLRQAIETLRRTFGVDRMAKDNEIAAAYGEAFKAASGDAKAMLAVEIADMMLEGGRVKEAEGVLARALSEQTADEMKRRLYIAYADAARYGGDAEKATAALEQADAIKVGRGGASWALSGALALCVEDYLAAGQYGDAEKAISDWEWESPIEKLMGYSSYLKAKMYAGRERTARALAELDAIVAATPESAYAAKALLEAARLRTATGDFDAARANVDKILSDYRTSGEAAEAKVLQKRFGADTKGAAR